MPLILTIIMIMAKGILLFYYYIMGRIFIFIFIFIAGVITIEARFLLCKKFWSSVSPNAGCCCQQAANKPSQSSS
jgi:hypothetical protein